MVINMEEKLKEKREFLFDFISNAIKQGHREGIEKEMKEYLTLKVPKFIQRQSEIPTYITDEVGIYANLMEEAKECYMFGLYYSTISMVGITAERFAIELSDKFKFTINENPISEKYLFPKGTNQYQRLRLLFKAKIISEKAYKNLDKIRDIRNDYIHPKKLANVQKDSLKVLELFIEVINSRFSEKYEFREGKIIKKQI